MLDIKEYLKQTKTVLVTQDAFDELVKRASAQPEPLTEEEMRLLKKLRSYHNGSYAKLLDKLVASAQPEPQWIPCSERLPDKSGLYLTWTKFPYEEEPSWLIINYDADCEAFGEWEEHYHPDTLGYLDSEFNEFENVFAWMPLPESYKGE